MVLVRPEDYSDENCVQKYAVYKSKTPKRTLQFSDGVLEEYSTDEEDSVPPPSQEIIDPSTLAWGPWIIFKTWAAGTSTLSLIDYLGETLASIFGLTTPRYYFELEEYKKRQADAAKKADEEKGWCDPKNEIIDESLKKVNKITAQPQIAHV